MTLEMASRTQKQIFVVDPNPSESLLLPGVEVFKEKASDFCKSFINKYFLLVVPFNSNIPKLILIILYQEKAFVWLFIFSYYILINSPHLVFETKFHNSILMLH